MALREIIEHDKSFDVLELFKKEDHSYWDGLVKRNEERSMDIIKNQLKLKV